MREFEQVCAGSCGGVHSLREMKKTGAAEFEYCRNPDRHSGRT